MRVPDLRPPEPRIYRSSPRSVTLQCGRCGLQWTITWYMLARAFEREVAPRLSVDAAAVTTAVLNVLGEHEARGRKRPSRRPVDIAGGGCSLEMSGG